MGGCCPWDDHSWPPLRHYAKHHLAVLLGLVASGHKETWSISPSKRRHLYQKLRNSSSRSRDVLRKKDWRPNLGTAFTKASQGIVGSAVFGQRRLSIFGQRLLSHRCAKEPKARQGNATGHVEKRDASQQKRLYKQWWV